MQDVVNPIARFIEKIYNRRRLRSALGYLPPEEFETIHTNPKRCTGQRWSVPLEGVTPGIIVGSTSILKPAEKRSANYGRRHTL